MAGQRISEYENALTPTAPKHPPGFNVVKRPGSPSKGTQLTDFPNEILTHILSHLHPDAHASVALVSKRFYALVTTPHAWQMAFLRHFPGQDLSRSQSAGAWDTDVLDRVRSESRPFARMTSLASWRSEYLLRTRLLRSAARGKPGALAAGSAKRASAVLTYNSKLPWMVSHIHAVFSPGPKRSPKAIHGSADLGVCTLGDPTSGKIERWGLDDDFSLPQLDDVFPQLVPFGTDVGPAATLNVTDVSVLYGLIAGEGFPGGRPFFRPVGEPSGRYLGIQPAAWVNAFPDDIPKIPEMIDAICSVWIAKSSAVPSLTQSVVGILTGSTLGVVTAYSLGYESSGPRYDKGDMTCRWVLSPGVPIVALKVDEHYSPKRKSLKRVWAVALNALGEVFYLIDIPTPPAARPKTNEIAESAWYTGRTAYWELIDSTRRTASPDQIDMDAAACVYSPRSSSLKASLTMEQLASEAQDISAFMQHTPSYFRKICRGWDMRRKLEVDFGGGGGGGGLGGEAIVVVTCGIEPEQPAALRRYIRHVPQSSPSSAASSCIDTSAVGTPGPHSVPSIFGSAPSAASTVQAAAVPLLRPDNAEIPTLPPIDSKLATSSGEGVEKWSISSFNLVAKGQDMVEITATAMDNSTYTVMTVFEDPLRTANVPGAGSNAGTGTGVPTPTTGKPLTGEIPGKRARMMAVGTNSGAVLVWNVRDEASDIIDPVRLIQTESPEISALGLSSLYVIHGGSDGLVQAWDPLASTLEPVRTLNARSSGRLPRAILNANPMLRDANHSAVGAIYLDPDPAAMRGILAFGTFLRYWTYSSDGGAQALGKKRRSRHHADAHGRLGSGRRVGGTVMDYIKAEAAELRRDQEHRVREEARLRSRFGVGLGDLTEEEAIRYAQLISEESFQVDEELRRVNTSDEAASVSQSSSSLSLSAVDADGEMGGSASPGTDQDRSTGTVTPDTSPAGAGTALSMQTMLAQQSQAEGVGQDGKHDGDYERQIQQAIRLSLLEAGVNEEGQSPRDSSSGEYEFQIKFKPGKKEKKKAAAVAAGSPSRSKQPLPSSSSASQARWGKNSSNDIPLGGATGSYEDDLELALRLSLQDAEDAAAKSGEGQGWSAAGAGRSDSADVEFPALEVRGKGKGRAT
ncbi:F-box and WD domain-containing protein [Magnaporthiopsis poae ATCC 64411]|uniref:F-box and WD domain-containing protein n=1 Tax=Magnaporthiopsis poae (strain ATCC 64411 / 73-15) TaxID=644358 RepID=A0A0C4DPH8_MAGP6|nr:F-box and WD domain-containing protein [Magnaporthiopsis poae ATCC 64411]